MKTTIIAIRTTIVTLVLTGLIYPFVMTGIAQVIFPWRANGSLVTDEKGQFVGSELIAQGFANPAYLQPRPSAAGEKGYDAASSSGSNLGSTSKKLQDRIKDDLKRLKEENPDALGPVPADLVTASGSGLDPHVSPQGALWQVPRVAKARGVTSDRVKAVVEANVEGRTFGLLGEPRVNVLLVNLALDRQFGKAPPLPAAPEKKEAKEESKKEETKETATPAQPAIQTAPPAAK
jgi:K+-transporting ATPase ATPase C chain